jgi:hypothetical protein
MLYNHAYEPSNNLDESQWLSIEQEAELYLSTLTEKEVNQIDEDYEWLGEPDYYQYEPDDDQWTLSDKDTDLFDNINY